MASFRDIKSSCPPRNRYANGGAVSSERKGAKTVINIVTPPAAAAASAPPAPPVPNSPSPQGAPVPPAAAAMALGQMQGKPGAPGAFKRGGRVKGCADGGNVNSDIRTEQKMLRRGMAKRADGGDVAQDKRTLKSMVKPSALKRANGGKVTETYGAESGQGRLDNAARNRKVPSTGKKCGGRVK
jgi:hypothetical protein